MLTHWARFFFCLPLVRILLNHFVQNDFRLYLHTNTSRNHIMCLKYGENKKSNLNLWKRPFTSSSINSTGNLIWSQILREGVKRRRKKNRCDFIMVVQLCALPRKFVISNLHCLVLFQHTSGFFFLLCVHAHIKMKKRVCLFLRSNYVVARVPICWERKCMFSMGGCGWTEWE